MSRACRPFGQRCDELDAGNALAQRAAAQTRRQQEADRVAGDQRGAVHQRAKRRIAARRHHHLHPERNDQRRLLGAAGKLGDPRDRFVAADGVDATAEDDDRPH
jgi:hypothetical protein